MTKKKEDEIKIELELGGLSAHLQRQLRREPPPSRHTLKLLRGQVRRGGGGRKAWV